MKYLKTIFLSFLIIVFFLSSKSYTQDENDKETNLHIGDYQRGKSEILRVDVAVSNGRFWEILNTQSKIFFLMGIHEGMALLFQEMSLKEAHINNKEILEAINSLSSSGFHFSDYVNQIDNFYEDRANIKIPIIEVYRFAQLKIKGISKEQLEKRMSILRQMYNN